MSIFSLLVFISLFGTDEPDSFVRNYETHIVVQNGKMQVNTSLSIQINNKSGSESSEVSISYEKNNPVKGLKAQLTDLNGIVIKKLSKKDVVERNDISDIKMYEDDLVLEFELFHNEYPYIIDYSYSQTIDQFISIDRWYPSHQNLHTVRASLTLDVPQDYKIQVVENKIDTAKISTTADNLLRRVWLAENIQKIKSEYYRPNWLDISPSVHIVPEQFDYIITGKTNSWASFGDWICTISQNSNDFNEAQINQLKSLVKGVKDKKEIIKIIYNYLQDEMRYIYVGYGDGGFKPFPASYVSANKYGDCKALTYYMKSALEVLGIESFPVLVYWSENPPALKETLPTSQFNHVFLCVPIENDTLWLENTSNTYPSNYLDTNKSGVKALLADKGKSHIITLPKLTYDDVLYNRSITYILAETNNMSALMHGTYKGDFFESIKYIEDSYSKKDQETWMMKKFDWSNAEIVDWKIISKDRNDYSVDLEVNFIQSGLTKNYGPAKAIFIPQLSLTKLEKPQDRKYELINRLPRYEIDTMRFDIQNKNFTQYIPPKDTVITNKYGEYSLKSDVKANQIICVRAIKFPAATVSPGKEYEAFYGFVDQIKKMETSTYITLKP